MQFWQAGRKAVEPVTWLATMLQVWGKIKATILYKEDQLQDYVSWFIKKLNNPLNWKHLQSCFVKTEVCNSLPRRYRTLKQYKLAELTPIEAVADHPLMCIRCGYPAVNASYYDLSFHPVSSNKDCKTVIRATGVAQYIKTKWRVVAIFNVILLVILDAVQDEMLLGCTQKSKDKIITS
ncbi:hypothetical protein HanXRQr2_Chr14g0659711 [Helianthus annuus]|uniref:Uncharacterized protein n=1 Tax=Helianthus annuus TaxID=4232 RepID=A0A251SKG3_HELAN|nr:hypothetical protein HanXRQr2_Chr14g0659711 [Helianthus annuus]KAJ0470158.1 hypothetical protein HanIR_Chr14g0715751 [Helianthus annuus]KAJ0486955.1 hypothetical protein HanHA89_Chr14g0585231 [Helianthus annuus]